MPAGGVVGAKVAFIEIAGSVFNTPMQFGPTMRIPYRRVRANSSRSRSTPSPPTSRKPAEMTTSPDTPASPHSSATCSTSSFGTTITPRSTGPGTVAIEGYARSECTTSAFGFTG